MDIRGLSALAERVHGLLTARHDLDVDGVAAELGVSPDQVREALDELADLALLKPSWQSPGGLRPVDPEAGLRALQQHQAELFQRQRELARSQASLTQLLAGYAALRPGHSPDGGDRIVGLDAIAARIEALASSATEEVASLMPGGPQLPAMIEAAKPLDRAVRDRGVRIRTLALDRIRQDVPTLGYAQWLCSIGAEVRTLPTLPVRMLVYDRRTALVPLDPDDTRAGVVQLSGPGPLAVVLALFDQLWESGTPVTEAPARDEDGLSPQERRLLRLLADGLTDEGAGRHLGLAPRTIRRIMADLMARLGARSRFEAGLLAAKRGWL
ncbi:LuxR family transcriptional regulator [Actinocorallia lasiicapitis]